MSKSKTSKHEIKLNKGQLIFSAIALTISLLITVSFRVLTGIRVPYNQQFTDISPPAQDTPLKPSPSDQKHGSLDCCLKFNLDATAWIHEENNSRPAK